MFLKKRLILRDLEKIVEKFWNLKLIKYPQDIFNLDYDRIEKMEGWGKQSVNNLKYSINERKKFPRKIYLLSWNKTYWNGEC